MSSIVVHDQMQRHLARELLVQRTQEAEKLLMSMALIALSDHLSLQGVQRRESSCSSIAFVVMGHGSATAFFERQAGLGPIQRLYLTLLVYTQHDCLLGWV